jgi:hypothetical protein
MVCVWQAVKEFVLELSRHQNRKPQRGEINIISFFWNGTRTEAYMAIQRDGIIIKMTIENEGETRNFPS